MTSSRVSCQNASFRAISKEVFNLTQPVPLVVHGHTRPLCSLAFNCIDQDGHYLLISSCKDSKPMIRDGMTGDWLGTLLGHKGAVWSSALDKNGTKAVTGSADFSAMLWDAYDGSCLAQLQHEHIVKAVDISASGTHIVTGGHEKKLRLYDLNDTNTPTFLKSDGSKTAHESNIKTVVYNEESSQIISADDRVVKVWDIRAGKCVNEQSLAVTLSSMQKSSDNSTLAIAFGKQVRFLKASNLEVITEFQLNYTPSSASLHPIHQDRFVTGSTADGWVRAHSAKTGDELEVLKGHHGPVHCISYSPDGELYASGSEDGTIRLWLTDSSRSYGLWRAGDV